MDLKDIYSIMKRKKNSHKGANGEVLIIGGSEDYVGCLVLAGLAALRSGVDWVTIAAPEKVGWAVSGITPDLIVKKFKGKSFSKEHVKDMLALSEKHDAVLIGNGIGRKSVGFVKEFVRKVKKPLVIDADGIKSICIDDVHEAILTPHKKEMKLFLENSGLDKINKMSSDKKIKEIQKIIKNNVIVVTGPEDLVITKDKVFVNRTGNAGMTKGGTGDVLAGICVGFLAKCDDLERSARASAYLNGKIGDILLKKKNGYSFIASDMVKEIKRFG